MKRRIKMVMFPDFMDNLTLQLALEDLDVIAFRLSLNDATFEEYQKQHHYVLLILECVAGHRKRLDWKWLVENDKISDKEMEWFEDTIKYTEILNETRMKIKVKQ